jgi:hypothetical protein
MPFVGIGTLPTPFKPASVPLPPETGGREHTSLRVGGWGGVPIPTRGIPCGTLYMYVLCVYDLSSLAVSQKAPTTLLQVMYLKVAKQNLLVNCHVNSLFKLERKFMFCFPLYIYMCMLCILFQMFM